MGNYKLTSAGSVRRRDRQGRRLRHGQHLDLRRDRAGQLHGNPPAGTRRVSLDTHDIDDDSRPQDTCIYDMGADEFLAATAPVVARRSSASGSSVAARLVPTKLPAPARSVVGGLAPEQISSSCKTCTGQLQLRKGTRGRIKTLRCGVAAPRSPSAPHSSRPASTATAC